MLQYVPEPATLHRAIRRIESGTLVTVRPGGEVEQERYFTPGASPRPAPTGRAAAHARIADVLRDSVAKHMRADVTVGAFLSGGIDSTAIAALAKEHNPDLITFTTGFEREGYSEVDVAAESAAAIGVRHVIRTVKPDEMMDALPLIVWYLDDPVADPALVPLWFIAREARQPRQGGAVRRGRGRAVRRLHDLPGAAVAGAVREGARARCAGCSARRRGTCRRACAARTCCAAARCRWSSATTATPGSSATTSSAGVLRRYDPRRGHIDITAAHYAESVELGPGGPDAARRPVHLAARRHPGQGRQDDDGELAGAAGAVPRPRGVRRRVDAAAVGEGRARGRRSSRCATRWTGIVPPHVLHRRKLGFPVPIRHWLRDEMYDWARGDRPRLAGRPPRRPRPPCSGCSTRTATGRSTTAAGSGRCWCSCSGTGSSSRSRLRPEVPGAGVPGDAVASRHVSRRQVVVAGASVARCRTSPSRCRRSSGRPRTR